MEDADLELTFRDAEEASDDDDGRGSRLRRATPRADADHAQQLRDFLQFLTDFYRFLPNFRTFLGDFNLQLLPYQ